MLKGKTAVVTGASRGIGAEIAVALAGQGVRVMGTYLSKKRRMEEVIERGKILGGTIIGVQADICKGEDCVRVFNQAESSFGPVDFLILNAAGGLEAEHRDDPDWPQRINLTAQKSLLQAGFLFPHDPYLCIPGAKIIYMTSTWAHRYGEVEQLPYYEDIGRAKFGFESDLRRQIPVLSRNGISVGFVCAGIVDGTATMLLLRRSFPEVVEELAARAGSEQFVKAADVASAVVRLLDSEFEPGDTVYVGAQAAVPLPSHPSVWDRSYVESKLNLYGEEAIFVDAFFPRDKDHAEGDFIVKDEYCRGHFRSPKLRVCPGHILIEAGAQALYLLWLAYNRGTHCLPLLQETKAKFLLPALPGDTLKVYAQRSGASWGTAAFYRSGIKIAEVAVKGALVSRQTAMAMLKRSGDSQRGNN